MSRPAIADPITPLFDRIIRTFLPVLERTTTHTWSGAEQLPAGGFVIAANHISNVDHFPLAHFLVAHGRAPHFLAKRSLFKPPVVRHIMAGTGQIPVDRGTAAAGHSLTDAARAVGDGKCVVVYPEGTITRDPQLWPMTAKTGAARLALRAGCPLLPLAVWGTQDILRPYAGQWMPKLRPAHHVDIVVGAPVPLDDLRELPLSRDVLVVATDRLMNALTDLVAGIRHEQPPVRRFDPRQVRNASEGAA